MVASIESSVDGLDSVSVGASWTPDRNGSQEVSVVVDPVGVVGELDEGNNMASKEVYVLCRVPDFGTTTAPAGSSTSSAPDMTTTTLPYSCIMPGNGPPCNEVTLREVVSGITTWSTGGMALDDVIALINSWADQRAYPPV